MVLLKIKPEVSQTQIDDLFAWLRRLPESIDGMNYVAGGPYSSDEGLNAGYTHGFLVTFASPASRDAYLVHPEHERIKQALLECLEAVAAFDFKDEG
jgi:hypothetical protein